MKDSAAIDNDFLSRIFEVEKDGLYSILCNFFNDLGVKPIVHEFVWEKEVLKSTKENVTLTQLIEEDKLSIINFSLIADSAAKLQYYKAAFMQVYKEFKGVTLTEEDALIWKYKSSYGEVHSSIMCVMINCGIFLSDDGHSKVLSGIIKDKYMKNIVVYNRDEACKHIREEESHMSNRKALHAIAHSQPSFS